MKKRLCYWLVHPICGSQAWQLSLHHLPDAGDPQYDCDSGLSCDDIFKVSNSQRPTCLGFLVALYRSLSAALIFPPFCVIVKGLAATAFAIPLYLPVHYSLWGGYSPPILGFQCAPVRHKKHAWVSLWELRIFLDKPMLNAAVLGAKR